MSDIDKAKRILGEGGYTCVLVCGEKVAKSSERGVKPLVGFLENGNFVGFSAADKVVGRAAAFLYIALGVKEVYAEVMSEGAQKLLKAHGIAYSGAVTAEKIINRRGDGLCPMETAVKDVSEPSAAYEAIKAKIAELRVRG